MLIRFTKITWRTSVVLAVAVGTKIKKKAQNLQFWVIITLYLIECD